MSTKIGNFGPLVFETGEERVLTPNQMDGGIEARYAEHQVIGFPPVPQFLGAGLDTLSLTVKLSRELGVDPEEELNNLREMCNQGRAESLFFGGKWMGLFTIRRCRWQMKRADSHGLTAIEVSLELKEHLDEGLD
jgi:phage protein U